MNDISNIDYDPRLIADIALGVIGQDQIAKRYGYSEKELETLMKTPTFRNEVIAARTTLLKDPLSFKDKAKILADHSLWLLAKDITTTDVPALRLEIMKYLLRASEEENKNTNIAAIGDVTINMNL